MDSKCYFADGKCLTVGLDVGSLSSIIQSVAKGERSPVVITEIWQNGAWMKNVYINVNQILFFHRL